jgi:hypothetical protein
MKFRIKIFRHFGFKVYQLSNIGFMGRPMPIGMFRTKEEVTEVIKVMQGHFNTLERVFKNQNGRFLP